VYDLPWIQKFLKLLVPRGLCPMDSNQRQLDAQMMIFSNLSVEESKNDDLVQKERNSYNWR